MKTLDNKKVFVSTPETSKAVLEKAFKLGYYPSGPESNFIEACFLFFSNPHAITFSKKLDIYIEHSFEEITVAEILAMELPELEEKFYTFQKVLVRSLDNEEWQPAFYKRKHDQYWHTTLDGLNVKQCIDYKKNKHFAFTTGKP